jgi:hypothetical protein
MRLQYEMAKEIKKNRFMLVAGLDLMSKVAGPRPKLGGSCAIFRAVNF